MKTLEELKQEADTLLAAVGPLRTKYEEACHSFCVAQNAYQEALLRAKIRAEIEAESKTAENRTP